MIFKTIIRALWLIFPAYVANATPVLCEGNVSIDGGKNFFDGNRILGDGKSIEGFFTGFIMGGSVGVLQIFAWTNPEVQIILKTQVWNWKVPILLSLGALLGDMVASFLKRRKDIPSGKSILLLDQLDFIIGAFLLVSLVWIPGWRVFLIWIVITPWIHLATNFFAYKLNFKSKPC
ncbi:hypothetical protein AKJ51_04280 [candidate division MSBL1 archaeon SCGC-AAA382A20]|uniref:CDP-2,3-bis-(O-geranylgeranyl)-sn-glycerol synthase n=1 Tax=candidate division MSBL1 archaeon SCGC-AAA382A20 TaxID=1698280 RepID=A0A133VI02_9EURY|nr:hypothetical protein AKJ51_04280 [candidate division MSBL1 archaeon SCGC-AAA382A20]